MAMNVFLQAPILRCESEIECGEMSEAVRAREKVRTVNMSGARCHSYKNLFLTRKQPYHVWHTAPAMQRSL